MLDFLDYNLKNKIISLFAKIFEVRLRQDKPVAVKGFDGEKVSVKYLSYSTTKNDLEKIIYSLCNYSVYSVEESLKNGFITSNDGERVGVCGSCVLSLDNVITIKDFSSLCIRIPNDVKGCSNSYFNLFSGIRSCLVVAKPFEGKTTFIRDLGRNYANEYNVLFIDERDELSASGKFNLGKNADVIRYSTKKFGFYNGVRSYNPDVIVCDEIMSSDDLQAVQFALLSGVKVVATIHSDNIKNLLKKQFISAIFKNKLFDDIIVLDAFKPTLLKESQWSKYLSVS